jgi:hypothetical protein
MNYVCCNGPYITHINYFYTIYNIHNTIIMTFPFKMFNEQYSYYEFYKFQILKKQIIFWISVNFLKKTLIFGCYQIFVYSKI